MANDYLKKFAPVATHLSSPTSATKSAQSGHPSRATECPLSAVKRTSTGGNPMSAFDPKRTLNDQLQKRWFELVPPYGSGVLHLLTAAFGTKRPLDKS